MSVVDDYIKTCVMLLQTVFATVLFRTSCLLGIQEPGVFPFVYIGVKLGLSV